MSKINIVNLASLTPMQDKKEVRSNLTIAILIALWLVMMNILIGCKSNLSQPTQVPPAATAIPAETPASDGSALLETRCSTCHSAAKPKQAQKTREQWEQTVSRMIGKGAQLTEAEKTVLVDYLAKTYGP